MTIREALAEGAASLAGAGIESPGLDSSLLLAEVLNTYRSKLTAAARDNISEASVATFRRLIKRRQSGECIAYILGKKEFYCLDFLVNPSVLVPRPDTETLVDVTLKIIVDEAESKGAGRQPPRVIDLCTGSGAIAIVLKHLIPELEVWATDISADALETAQKNASRLLPPNSIRFFQGDLYDALPPRTPNHDPRPPVSCSLFPLIISNPPYIPSAEISSLPPEVRMEPTLALDGGDDGLHVIRKIISRAPEFLCKGGCLLLEADPRQMAAIADLYNETGFSDIQTHADLSGRERVISGVMPRRLP
jgi:release factor glutamine methyltransferase